MFSFKFTAANAEEAKLKLSSETCPPSVRTFVMAALEAAPWSPDLDISVNVHGALGDGAGEANCRALEVYIAPAARAAQPAA